MSAAQARACMARVLIRRLRRAFLSTLTSATVHWDGREKRVQSTLTNAGQTLVLTMAHASMRLQCIRVSAMVCGEDTTVMSLLSPRHVTSAQFSSASVLEWV